MSRVPPLILAYLHRIGATPSLTDGRLTIANASLLCESDRELVVQYKAELILLLQRGGNRDDFRWPDRVNTDQHRARALPRSLPGSHSHNQPTKDN